MVSPTKPKSGSPISVSPEKQTTQDAANASSAENPDNSDSTGHALVTSANLPASVLTGLSIFIGGDGKAYMEIPGEGNTYALRIGGRPANRVLRRLAHKAGVPLRSHEIRELNDDLMAHAEHSGDVRDVYYRCAPYQNGVELDLGDDLHIRIRAAPGNVVIVRKGSETLFHRTPAMRPLPMPADVGDLKLLNKYINLAPASVVLLTAWISYTLAHSKVSTTNFVILVLQGDQGSGKTFLCKLIQALIDPSVAHVQTFPHSQKDLVIAALNAHVLFFDNLRTIKQLMADTLCTASTGGHLTTRQLYTDAEQQVHRLHVALVLNGIHSFIDQPDLAQRCLPLHLRAIDEKNRRSEAEIFREFQDDLPKIFRGLLEHIADVLTHLPTVEVVSPERMIDFSLWLAAEEKVDGLTKEIYQAQYSEALNGAMLDSLMENPLAAAVMSFITDASKDQWSGTPTELLQELNLLAGKRTQYSRDWPQTASALSKRLRSLQAGLRRQGIDVTLTRGRERKITIVNMEAF